MLYDADKPLPGGKGRALVPALLCAVLSAFLMRCGLFWSFFFVIPFGFMALAYSPAGAWVSWAAASILNIFVTVFLYFGTGFSNWIFGVLYFTVMSLGFVWIIAGEKSGIRAVYRFVIASCAGAAVSLVTFADAGSRAALGEIIRAQAEMLSSAYIDAAEGDAVQRTLLEQALTPENMTNFVTQVILRGGALVSCCFLFFISRQAAFLFAGLARRRRYPAWLSSFHAPAVTIWALSLSLGLILVFRRAGLEIPELAAWNILVICGILFLAQGAGIVLHLLSRWRPVTRLLGNMLIIVVMFSPGINAVAIGVLILLGIAENWLPLRAPKKDASTPGQ